MVFRGCAVLRCPQQWRKLSAKVVGGWGVHGCCGTGRMGKVCCGISGESPTFLHADLTFAVNPW